jgi:hypothetical protein
MASPFPGMDPYLEGPEWQEQRAWAEQVAAKIVRAAK